MKLLEVDAIGLVSDENTNCVFTALFVDLIVEMCKFLIKGLLAAPVCLQIVVYVDGAFGFTEESSREGSLLLCLRPEPQLCLGLSIAWERHLLRVIVYLLRL